MKNPTLVIQDNQALLEHGKKMEREIKMEQQEKMLNHPNLRSQMKTQLQDFRNANTKKQYPPPPNVFSQEYSNYNSVKPSAVPSARIRLGGVF
jgi:hypothetical protein